MKILNRDQIYKADQATIQNQDITSLTLMERASGKAFDWLNNNLSKTEKIHVFCGIGNNGGDGLVIARRLLAEGFKVQTYIVAYADKRSADFEASKKKLEKEENAKVQEIQESSELPEIKPEETVIDAIFGIGYNRPAPEWVQELFRHINNSSAFVVGIDIASGLYLDEVPKEDEPVVQVDMLLTFQVPKLVMFLPQTGKNIKEWKVLDIGLDDAYLSEAQTDIRLIDFAEIKKRYKKRDKYTHKGTFGHSLIIGGSYGKMGAVVLSAKACLKAGSGLVSTYIPQFAMPILQSTIPEVMVLTDRHTGKMIEEIAFDLEPDVIGIGMGMETAPITIKALGNFLKVNQKPLVIDADALNCISKNKEFLNALPPETVLTPHPKELQRLIGEWEDDFDKLEKAKEFASTYNLVLVIKGANTITVHNKQLYINTTGNPGMATGGTGDVLTGIITALIAQGYSSLNAAIVGVYLHGLAGDLAAKKMGFEALSVGDVVAHIGKAYLKISGKMD
ncbi:bifunctional ADP-dependent NAD(P)H-hydrate dehydratase/NAD(P)H-hydrate epimerase [Flavimarina sp. Hel_I_48]|uniref:bifunctional ADP-dependent NAD(P)H-hydrate dehydratase/NAD(P)H-hydrate epimerase n=1 Tax=Flavimarina sp. Hel_I_48 TaxID=1392488 RepID=UPI0004DEFF9B|nr:bifunctional ADP-dependent NAD(P)H-hydrate dehydratase/NAD(P)H-hydrate epimerase [Flavimarina sp. Hel_I_48]